MNITDQEAPSELIQLMGKIDRLLERYGKEEDPDIRRDMRKKYKELVAKYETLSPLKEKVWKKTI